MDDGIKDMRCKQMNEGWWPNADSDLHVAEHKIPA